MDDLISVQEAAEYYGITRQAVYKKMRSSWKRYVVNHVNQLTTGSKPQKMLRSSVLTDFPGRKQVDNLTTTLNQNQPEVYKKPVNHDNPVDNPEKTAPESSETAFLHEEISFLREQLRAKDRQLEAKDEQIRQIRENLLTEQIKTAKLTARLTAYQEPPDQEAARPEPDQEEQPQPKGWWHNLWHGRTPKP